MQQRKVQYDAAEAALRGKLLEALQRKKAKELEALQRSRVIRHHPARPSQSSDATDNF